MAGTTVQCSEVTVIGIGPSVAIILSRHSRPTVRSFEITKQITNIKKINHLFLFRKGFSEWDTGSPRAPSLNNETFH